MRFSYGLRARVAHRRAGLGAGAGDVSHGRGSASQPRVKTGAGGRNGGGGAAAGKTADCKEPFLFSARSLKLRETRKHCDGTGKSDRFPTPPHLSDVPTFQKHSFLLSLNRGPEADDAAPPPPRSPLRRVPPSAAPPSTRSPPPPFRGTGWDYRGGGARRGISRSGEAGARRPPR